MQPVTNPATPVQSIQVYPSEAFSVTAGANLGDGISFSDDLMLDDIYGLDPSAQRARLALSAGEDGGFAVAEGTALGQPGHRLHLDCAVTLMAPDGQCPEALILVEVDDEGNAAAIYLLPLAPLVPRTDYALVGVDTCAARRKFAQVASVSFTRGTHITMMSGAQVAIEDLKVGDKVLTRDGGAQAIRWIGHSTVRATGDFAPIMIRAGTLNNANDLLVSPAHRLFIYQRTDRIGAGQSELLVKARHLINGDTVYVQDGGYVDYFQLLFDHHHIIYAEGIAAESMLVDPRTRPALPSDLLDRLGELMPQHARTHAHGLDVQKALLDRPDAIDLLRRASSR